MKRLTGIVFILISLVATGKSSESIIDYFNIFKDKEHIESLKTEQKDKLLIIRKQYFSELQVIRDATRELRKQANESTISNNEIRCAEIHKKMHELKEQKKKLKESYKKEIEKILREEKNGAD